MIDSIIIVYVLGYAVALALFPTKCVPRIEKRAGVEMKVPAAMLFVFIGAAVWPLIVGVAFLIGFLKAALNLVYVLYRAVRVEER